MCKTYLISTIQKFFYSIKVYSLGDTFVLIINLLIGFFIATILTTIVGQTGDWGILAGAISVTYLELLSQWIYSRDLEKKQFLMHLNSVRIGIIYGMFVDAFKLGS
uniref:hypothetical protein n=1 Tax=Chroothece richteriana TaxID=101928 RepID=UPI001FCDF734|nr:hypothetical protein MW631_pgp145 [Chroothece richteriana]UNJ14163.1 hypothetical protein [Chroothece richteriana]